ncbi:MAG: hypothetical protein OXI13_04665 [Gammaproteobacteria bacterium]|nr:hypothetical protein [Gammaproteobacteria bacterium]MYA66831.1 hypothetical protein [Gammaproteobacteria bacterium]MYH45490.1 hypothetical protein [Gammaproteobacteria bacterium]MYL14823.1 hypothetical protein [Gammaproteobacteria bacterium]
MLSSDSRHQQRGFHIVVRETDEKPLAFEITKPGFEKTHVRGIGNHGQPANFTSPERSLPSLDLSACRIPSGRQVGEAPETRRIERAEIALIQIWYELKFSCGNLPGERLKQVFDRILGVDGNAEQQQTKKAK